MPEGIIYLKDDWWAYGDAPVRKNSQITFLIDGRFAMLEICKSLLKAKKYAYLANWGMSLDFEMVRGNDKRVGKDGSFEQKQLIKQLKNEGLDDNAITFWCHETLTVQNVLSYVASKGVPVKVLLWGSLEVPFFSFYKPSEICKALRARKIDCLIDKSARGLRHHQVESLHQKISIFDGDIAFVGGVDPMLQKNDFDRWDISSHPYTTPLRGKEGGKAPHSWHDAHALLKGPVAWDVESNFQQRWNDVVKRQHFKKRHFIEDHPMPRELQGTGFIQVTRTIPKYTYHFRHNFIQGVAQSYEKAFSHACEYVYLENQYIWLHEFMGIDIPFLGKESKEMVRNMLSLARRIEEGVYTAIILPDDPNLGRIYTDAAIDFLRKHINVEKAKKHLHIFTLACSTSEKKKELYRPIYVHAKVGIVDDKWATVGSGNLNNRGMRDDTEMNVATLDSEKARGLRLLLWAEHLQLLDDEGLYLFAKLLEQKPLSAKELHRAKDIEKEVNILIGDFINGLELMKSNAHENLERYKKNLPLKGHLLPYLTQEEAIQEGLGFQLDHGWIER